MKKLLIVLLLLAMFIPQTAAFAIDIDYKSLSDQDLSSIIDKARAEIAFRQPDNPNHLTIANENNIEIYLDRRYEEFENYDKRKFVALGAAIVNGSDKPIELYDNGCCINGWKVDTILTYGEIPAGKSKKIDINLCLDDAGISSFDEITDIYFAFQAMNMDDILHPYNFAPYTFAK